MEAAQTDLKHLPRGLTKGEKSALRRLLAMREAVGDAVEPTELDLLVDYIRARKRLAELEASLQRDDYVTPLLLAHHAAIRAQAAACRRLAKDLRLVNSRTSS